VYQIGIAQIGPTQVGLAQVQKARVGDLQVILATVQVELKQNSPQGKPKPE
jgi:hypothetical protein